MTTPAPTPTKPEPFEITCQACERRGWKGEACSRCDGTRYTSIWDCGRCGEEFDGRESHIDLPHREHVLRATLVTYTVGCRTYVFCSNCAPAEAIGDGAHLRDLISKVRGLLCELNHPRAARKGFAIGAAREIEAGLLEIAEWSGVAPDARSMMPAADEVTP